MTPEIVGHELMVQSNVDSFSGVSELTYSWVQTQGIEVAIEDANSNTLSFMAPNVSVASELGFKLSVSDGEGR